MESLTLLMSAEVKEMVKEFTAMQKRNRNGEDQFLDRYVNGIVNLKILFHIDGRKHLTQECFSLNVRIYVCRSTLNLPTAIY